MLCRSLSFGLIHPAGWSGYSGMGRSLTLSLLISLCLMSWPHSPNSQKILPIEDWSQLMYSPRLDFGFTVLEFSNKNLLCQQCSSNSGCCWMPGEPQWKIKHLLTVGWKPTMNVFLAQKQVAKARYECATTSDLFWDTATILCGKREGKLISLMMNPWDQFQTPPFIHHILANCLKLSFKSKI